MSFTNRRVRIRNLTPEVDCGRWPAKRSRSELVECEADVFADSHDLVRAVLHWRTEDQRHWTEVPMTHLEQDRWHASFRPAALGLHTFRVLGWIDRAATWQRDLRTKLEADVAGEVDLLRGVELVDDALVDCHEPDQAGLRALRDRLADTHAPLAERGEAALTDASTGLLARNDPRVAVTTSEARAIRVDRDKARFSAWYELFPRSTAPEPGAHGTFDDVIARLPYVAGMGFDVLYLPPIHPIGTTHRKGPNNRAGAGPHDPGSPWAIGSTEGGHTAIHPRLGDRDGFRRLLDACAEHGLELALDIAFQCSPDHPWVREHPEWFRRRPDGGIQYAENPPKKYQDIYPLDFETRDPEGLWQALRGVFEHWIAEGVRIFRVDNPHTKSFAFWEWCVAELAREHPDMILLSEAFTRPIVMYELARLGFTQSYTYFAWRHRKDEFEAYYRELFQTEVVEYFRANSWPNTPDILTGYLQDGGRPAFEQRLVLAATLTANYGVYGPVYELMHHRARPGVEEYLDNEKYEIHHWDLDPPPPLYDLISRVNRIRRDHPALQQDRNFEVHHIANDELLAFSKASHDLDDVVLVVVNLDTSSRQAGVTRLDLARLGLADDAGTEFEVHDLLDDARYLWRGPENYVELDPRTAPAHIFHVRPRQPHVSPAGGGG